MLVCWPILLLYLSSSVIECNQFSFLIISQNGDYDLVKSQRLKGSINYQSRKTHIESSAYFSHNSFGDVYGHWAIWPLLPKIYLRMLEDGSSWLIILEPDTTVDLPHLKEVLDKYDHQEDHFLGYGLVDKEPTIIHHFYGFDDESTIFNYPDLAAGVAISRSLLHKLVSAVNARKLSDFAIDAKHEFARFVLASSGISLKSLPESFCLFPYPACALAYHEPTYSENEVCKRRSVTIDDVFAGVKTFSGFHRTRVVVIKRTWAKEMKYIEFFSDVEDHYVPTKTLGIDNTERGHCAKTLAILQHYLTHNDVTPEMNWLLVADDDTLLSVPRLFRLLTCYDSSKPVIIGERYGYGFGSDGTGGYDYPTGGSGMIFSKAAVEKLVKSCRCPAVDSPDDMIIGACARTHSIPIIHSAAFHQAKSVDYARPYTTRIQPISFHKFEDIDPYKDYMDLLHEEEASNWRVHSEL